MDSRTGERQARPGAVLAASPDRHRLAEGSWRLTRKDGAAGIDGQTAKDYEVNLQANLMDLLERIKSGRYQAPPVRRTYIPKADGTRRPLGIPTLEDKVVQRAIAMVLAEVYEQDFLDCSYGFRPGRSAHQALQALRAACMDGKLRWVLDVDVRKYFDTIAHAHLRELLDRRVTDGVIRRMIDKWLKAGVLEGRRLDAASGTPQGGVITPRTQKVTSAVGACRTATRRWFAASGGGLGWDGNGVADHDAYHSRRGLLDQQPYNLLAIMDVDGLRRRRGACRETRRAFRRDEAWRRGHSPDRGSLAVHRGWRARVGAAPGCVDVNHRAI